MHLDLEDSGLDFAVLEDFSELLELEVGDSDVLSETSFLASFHGVVSRLVSHSFLELEAFNFSVRLMDPFWGVSDLGVDVLKSNGEVDDVKIEVSETEVLQRSLKSGSDMLSLVEGVPKLGDNKEVFSLDSSGLDDATDSFSDFLLVSIITSSIEESVSSLNGVNNDISGDVLGKFPEAKSSLRHLSS
jgi:hypothetical protein